MGMEEGRETEREIVLYGILFWFLDGESRVRAEYEGHFEKERGWLSVCVVWRQKQMSFEKNHKTGISLL